MVLHLMLVVVLLGGALLGALLGGVVLLGIVVLLGVAAKTLIHDSACNGANGSRTRSANSRPQHTDICRVHVPTSRVLQPDKIRLRPRRRRSFEEVNGGQRALTGDGERSGSDSFLAQVRSTVHSLEIVMEFSH